MMMIEINIEIMCFVFIPILMIIFYNQFVYRVFLFSIK